MILIKIKSFFLKPKVSAVGQEAKNLSEEMISSMKFEVDFFLPWVGSEFSLQLQLNGEGVEFIFLLFTPWIMLIEA